VDVSTGFDSLDCLIGVSMSELFIELFNEQANCGAVVDQVWTLSEGSVAYIVSNVCAQVAKLLEAAMHD